MTANGKSIGENCRGATIEDERVIRPFTNPLKEDAGFIVLRGNLFDSAIMKTSVISPEFRAALPQPSGRSRSVRGPGGRLRWPGGLSPPHRRPFARHHHRHVALHARRGSGGLPGFRGSGEHAAAGLSHPRRRARATLHWRRTAIGYLGFALHSQREPRGRGDGRTGVDPHGRSCPHRPRQGHGQRIDQRRGTGRAPPRTGRGGRLPLSGIADALAGDSARASSGRWKRAPFWKVPRSTSRSRRRRVFRGIAIERAR